MRSQRALPFLQPVSLLSPPPPPPPPPLPPNSCANPTVLSDAVPLVASRALVSEAPELLSTGFAADPCGRAKALSNALELLHPQRAASFEAGGAAPARLRRALAAAYEACEEWGAAARALAGIDVESVGAAAAAAAEAKQGEPASGAAAAASKPTPSLAPATAEKLRHCVRVAMLFLEDEDAGSAESYVKKGAPFAAALTSAAAEARSSSSSRKPDEAAATADLGLELQYRSCAARVLDARRDFTRAAAAYATLSRAREGSLGGGARAPPVWRSLWFLSFFLFYERGRARGLDDGNSKDKNKLTSLCSLSGQLSHRHSQPQELVSDADLDAALSAAVTCAVLAPPGPARTRVLAGLGRDERSARLPLSGVLASVRSQRLLTREDAAALDSALTMPHHRAVGGDGATVLERALREHNLSAAAGVYGALTLEALGELLGLGRGAGAGGRGGRQKSAAEEAVSRWRTRCRGGDLEVGTFHRERGGNSPLSTFPTKKKPNRRNRRPWRPRWSPRAASGPRSTRSTGSSRSRKKRRKEEEVREEVWEQEEQREKTRTRAATTRRSRRCARASTSSPPRSPSGDLFSFYFSAFFVFVPYLYFKLFVCVA